jgi:hypothetical protein
MKPYNDFTLVIQGPLHKNSIHGALNNYSEYTDNIIFSHWKTDNVSMFDELRNKNILFRGVGSTPHKNFNAFNNQNVYYQVYTTLAGMEIVTTPYVIKLRSDQWYGDLVPFFEQVRREPSKYTCANLHFRPDNLYKYHPSDKLIGGRTVDLLKTFTIAMERITLNVQAMLAGAYMYYDGLNIGSESMFSDVEMYDHADQNRPIFTRYPEKPLLGTIQILPAGYIGLVPEMVIGTSFLFAKGIYPSPNNSVEIVKDNFRIVRVEDMLPYLNKDGGTKIEHNSTEIHRIEDYG